MTRNKHRSTLSKVGCHGPEGAGAVKRVSRPAEIDTTEPFCIVMTSFTREVNLVALFVASDTLNILVSTRLC